MQAVEAAAHVAGLDGDEDLQAAGEAQHGRGLANSRMRAAASGIWPGAVMASFAPPGRMSSMAAAGGIAWISASTSESIVGCDSFGMIGAACRLRFWSQPASV